MEGPCHLQVYTIAVDLHSLKKDEWYLPELAVSDTKEAAAVSAAASAALTLAVAAVTVDGDSKMAARCLENVSRPEAGGGRGLRRASGDGRGISGDINDSWPNDDADGERWWIGLAAAW